MRSRFRTLIRPVRNAIAGASAALLITGGPFLWHGNRVLAATAVWSTVAAGRVGQTFRRDLDQVLNANRSLIIQSYQRAFGRQPTEAELNFWAGQLYRDPHKWSGARLIAAHKTSLRGAAGERQEVVRRAFQAAVKRQPSEAEITRWDGELKDGKDYEEVLALLVKADQQSPNPTRPPRAPANLRLSALTPFAMEGTFAQVGTDVAEFRIQRWTGSVWGLFQRVTANGGAGTVYRFTMQTRPQQGETFRVCAYDAAGREGCSAYKGIQTPATPAPAGFTLRAPSAFQIEGSYTQVGTDVTEFRVQRWTGTEWVLFTTQPAARDGTAFSFAQETRPEQGETFRVCAYAGGAEACTDSQGIQTPSAPPSNVTARGQDQTTVQLTWQWNGGTDIKIQWLNGQTWQTVASGGAGATSAQVNVDSLSDDSYQFRVCAGTNAGDTCSAPVVQGKQFDHPMNFTQLDYGIYWFRCGICRASTRPDDKGWNSDAAKAVPGLSTEYFDPSKPTLIYVHGWEKDTVKDQFRESMKSPTTEEDMLKGWKDRGWNVGIFYWNQFSDDDWGVVPNDTEPKIWTATDQVGMRYKVSDRSVDAKWKWGGTVNQTAADLFYASYRSAMANYTGNNIRIVGHSLGNQMAVRMVKILSDSNPPARLIPNRVALLEPYYTQDSKNWLPNKTTTYKMVGAFVADLEQKHNIIFEYYKSSGITPENAEVIRHTVYTRIHPNYADWGHGAHVAAVHWYFLTIDWNLWAMDGDSTVGFAPTAGMSDAELRKLQGCDCYFSQRDAGSKTTNVDDDAFDRRRW